MRAVNLLPADRASSKRGSALPSSLALPAVGAVTAAAIAGLVFAVWSTNSSVSSKQQQLNTLQAQVAKLPKLPAASTSTALGAPSRASTVISLVDNRMPWDEFLGTFSRVVPENVWLSSLQAATPGAAAAVAAGLTAASASTSSTPTPAPVASAGTNNFTITGYTYSQPSVARLMRRLALIPWLSDVSLVSSAKSTVGQTTVFQFTVGATVVPQPGGAS